MGALFFVTSPWVYCVFVVVFLSGGTRSGIAAAYETEYCSDDNDCVKSGRCLSFKETAAAGSGGESNHDSGVGEKKRCLCKFSCDSLVPIRCTKERQCHVDAVKNSYENRCDKENRLCLCPAPKDRDHACLKKNLRIIYLNATRQAPYLGESVTVTCCVNVDPNSVQLQWYHNKTKLNSSEQPDEFRLCWLLRVTSVRMRDSGVYTCSVSTDVHKHPIKASLNITVQASPLLALNATAVNSTSITVGIAQNLPTSAPVTVRLDAVNGQYSKEVTLMSQQSSVTFSDVSPATLYAASASAPMHSDKVPITQRIFVHTSETTPGPPQLLSMFIQDPSTRTRCEISWELPLHPNGRILYYKVDISGVLRWYPDEAKRHIKVHKPKSFNCQNLHRVAVADPYNKCEIKGLLPNRNYSATVTAVSSAGESPPARFTEQCSTNFGVPDHIETPVAEKAADSKSIRVIFPSAPEQSKGPITGYYLAIVPYTMNTSFVKVKPSARLQFETYERAVQNNLVVTQNPTYAYIALSFRQLPHDVIVGASQETQNLEQQCDDYLGVFRPHNGELLPGNRYTGFLIVRVDPDVSMYRPNENKRFVRQQWPQPLYGYSDFFTPVVLAPESGVVTQYKSEDSKDQTLYLLSIGLTVSLVIVAFCFFGLYSHVKGWLKMLLCVETNFLSRRKSFTELQRVIKCRDFQPIPVENLPLEYIQRHRDSDFLFTVEYESLPNFNFDTTASDKPENTFKNRYNDIKAFDVTRVKLKESENLSSSDYINANFVQGYKGRKVFIAAQGPTQDTVNDFWQMVWEHNVYLMIMVTNLQERYRTICIQYWPDQGATRYGCVEVRPLECNYFADYVVRKFQLEYVNYPVAEEDAEQPLKPPERQVIQYHYTGWRDYRAPEETGALLRFQKQLRKLSALSTGVTGGIGSQSSPILVHCSAGVGRTGTFIAIDSMMDQMNEEGTVDIFGFVSNMRRQRNFMVQCLEQYVFIYKALAEWYMFGDTDLEIEKIDEHVKKQRVGAVGEASLLREEFEKLSMTLEDVKASEFARKEHNVSKNRYQDVVPYDRFRIILAPMFGFEDASYINASPVRGYFNTFILTQDPLVETIWDFWRMVSEQSVGSIVMLSHEAFLSESERYWPAEINHSLMFGDKQTITVQLLSEEESHYFNCRKFNVSSSKEREAREVVQYCYADWTSVKRKVSETCSQSESAIAELAASTDSALVPNSTASFLDLIGKVLQRQLGLPKLGPIVIHCRDGSTKSGLYCAVSLLLERLKAENRVDVFQTVKTLRAQRPGIITTLQQYEFCYQAVIDYLQSFR